MVERAVKSYRVAYERDESGWWVATVRGVRGCHTQGRTVDEARRRIREALGLFVDDARKATIVDEVKLPTAATRAIRAYATLRKKADEEDRRAARAADAPSASANRKTEDERARCGSSPGVVTSARTTSSRKKKETDRPHATLGSRWHEHAQASHARASSSLNAWRRQYRWRKSVAHLRILAARLLGAKATHDATSSAAWP